MGTGTRVETGLDDVHMYTLRRECAMFEGVDICIVFPGGEGGRASWYNDVPVIRRLDKYTYMDFGGRIYSYRKYNNRIVSVRYSLSLSTLPSIPARDR